MSDQAGRARGRSAPPHRLRRLGRAVELCLAGGDSLRRALPEPPREQAAAGAPRALYPLPASPVLIHTRQGVLALCRGVVQSILAADGASAHRTDTG